MGSYAFLLYVGCIAMIIIIGRIFIFPIKKILKLIANSLIGTALIYIINLIGANFGFHIGLNWWTVLCTGLLGIPGVILVVLIKLFIF